MMMLEYSDRIAITLIILSIVIIVSTVIIVRQLLIMKEAIYTLVIQLLEFNEIEKKHIDTTRTILQTMDRTLKILESLDDCK